MKAELKQRDASLNLKSYENDELVEDMEGILCQKWNGMRNKNLQSNMLTVVSS